MTTSTKTKAMNTPSLTSAFSIARTAYALPADVIAIATRLNIDPAMVIDNKPFFGADDARRIILELRGLNGGGGLVDRANHLS